MKRRQVPAQGIRRFCRLVAAAALLHGADVPAEAMPVGGDLDSRIRVAVYQLGQVYRLHGFVGYQIDLEFESGETFLGLGSGDIEGLSFVAQDNHLFLKPKAARVATNLTVLTSRRQYQFDYTSAPRGPDQGDRNVIYALRFVYPAVLSQSARDAAAARVEAQLREAASGRPGNLDYWYCGDPSIRPVAASDDGVHTRLRFGAHAELPAIFVGNDDGSESLLNFSMDGGDVIVHRVARRFIVRRGRLTGCIVNKGYAGGGTRLDSGTIAPEVERTTAGSGP